MTLVTEIRKTVADATPVYAAVGVTDLAVEKVRSARVRASAARREFDTASIQKDLSRSATALQKQAADRAAVVARQVQQAPAAVVGRSLELAAQAQEQYDTLAARGEKLVKRIRAQKATKDLLAQVDQTVAAGKGAVTTVRKAVNDTQASALATFTTGRREAAQDADLTVETVKASATRTRTAAKRTATTARKRTATVRAQGRTTATGARKAAASARRATTAAADKVGDETQAGA